jgi:hypothetical protein
MSVSTINKKQLTVDTSFVENDHEIEYEKQQQQPRPIMATNQPTTPTRIVPAYCVSRDNTLKLIAVSLFAVFNAISLTLDWYFTPYWIATNIIRRVSMFICYAFVIVTTDLDEILNIKHSTNEKIVFCRFVSYCDWIIAFIEIAEGLLSCIEHFVNYGGLLSPYTLYTSISKFILYVYILKNI